MQAALIESSGSAKAKGLVGQSPPIPARYSIRGRPGRREALLMNALERISCYGGGSMIELDGTVSVNNSNSMEALSLAKSWLGTISPRGETTYSEEDCRQIFEYSFER
jgi:hypothetical protein